jgi:hypothetical protein
MISMRVPHGSVMYVMTVPAGFRLDLLDEGCVVLHVEPDVSRVGACALSALANRIWAPGTSTTGALLRVPALPPHVFAYHAWRRRGQIAPSSLCSEVGQINEFFS